MFDGLVPGRGTEDVGAAKAISGAAAALSMSAWVKCAPGVGVPLGDADAEGDGEDDAEGDVDGDEDGEALGDALGVGDCDEEGEGDGPAGPVREKSSAWMAPCAYHPCT